MANDKGSIAESHDDRPDPLVRHNRRAIVSGIVVAALVIVGVLLIGRTTTFEARILIEAMLPSLRLFYSAVSTASATTLALMLTLLGLSSSINTQLKPSHYRRVLQISLLDVLAFSLSIVLLLVLAIPLAESEELPVRWYSSLYYGLLVLSAALGGLIVAVIVLIYGAVEDLIDVVHSESESALAVSEGEAGRSEGEGGT